MDFDIYRDLKQQRLDPSVTIMQGINSQIRKTQKKIVFADGEDENTLKAAIAFKNIKIRVPLLVGKKQKLKSNLKILVIAKTLIFKLQIQLIKKKKDM